MRIFLVTALCVTLSRAQHNQNNMQIRWQLPQQQQQPNNYNNNNYNNNNYNQNYNQNPSYQNQQRPNYGGGGQGGSGGPGGFGGPNGPNGPPGDFMPPGSCKEQQKLMNCMNRMSQVPGVQPPPSNRNQQQQQQQQNSLPMDRPTFEAGCRAYEQFNQCLDESNLRSICAEDPFIRQLDGSTGYMCKDPQKTEILNALPCLKQLESDPTIRKCMEDQPRSPPSSPAEQCKLVQKGLNCGKDIYMKCGDRVYDIMVTVTENSMRIIDPNCRLERANGERNSFDAGSEAFRSSAGNFKGSEILRIFSTFLFAFFFKFLL